MYKAAEAAGRPREEWPRIWVTFRPIVAETDELAWQKAHQTLAALTKTHQSGLAKGGLAAFNNAPQNEGSKRLLALAEKGEVHDRALWYPTVTATNARGASTALVGSWKTVAESILDYVDLGCELISIRGYDNLNDMIDYGRHVLPLVREGIREREGKGIDGQIKTEDGDSRVSAESH